MIQLKRGTAFRLEVPSEENVTIDWAHQSQARQVHNSLSAGFVANLHTEWKAVEDVLSVVITHKDTSKWPLGEVDMDVVFFSPAGTVLRSDTYQVNVLPGITQI